MPLKDIDTTDIETTVVKFKTTADELTDEERQKFKNLFSRFDKDGDGSLSIKEFG